MVASEDVEAGVISLDSVPRVNVERTASQRPPRASLTPSAVSLGVRPNIGLEALRTDPRRPLVWGRLLALDGVDIVPETPLEYDVDLGEVGGRRRIVTMQWISLQRASQ